MSTPKPRLFHMNDPQDWVHFRCSVRSPRIVFGQGSIRTVSAELDALGAHKAIMLSTPRGALDAEKLAQMIGSRAVVLFSEAQMHTPVEITEVALAKVYDANIDAIVALGGGSTTGLSKAIALRTGLPQIVIPTTYAGSEMTPILGETENRLKKTILDDRVLPSTVIYDPDVTYSLPPNLSAASGLNAVAHAVEALYAKDRNPVISLIAEEGIRLFGGSLPGIVETPNDRIARTSALLGACLCGIALGNVGMGLHHKLCHALGGLVNAPHAETHAIILAHVIRYNSDAAERAIQRVARALDVGDAAIGIFELLERSGIPIALRDIGVPHESLAPVADLASSDPYWNPRPVDRDALVTLLDDAWHGRRPN